MTLGEYLRQPLPAFDFVHNDCCRWVARWLVLNGHACPIEVLGLRYDSERSALRAIRRGGGLVELWSRGMELAGVPVTETPVAGDVGVIASPTLCGSGEAAGIFTGERWVSLGLRGFDAAAAVAVRAWRV